MESKLIYAQIEWPKNITGETKKQTDELGTEKMAGNPSGDVKHTFFNVCQAPGE